MLRIGLIGFGGGNALIPVIQKDIVEENALISASDYEEDVVVASITPGALPVEVAGGLGKRICGRRGMLLTAAAMALPGVLLTVLLLSLSSGLGERGTMHVQFLTVGVVAYISALLTQYIYGTAQNVKHRENGRRGRMLLVYAVILAVFAVTCGKTFYRILGIDRMPVFSVKTAQVFVAAFFVMFYTNGRVTRVTVPTAIVTAGMYFLCAGSSPVIRSRIVFYAVCAVMVGLALCGFLKGMREANDHAHIAPREVVLDLGVTALGIGAAMLLAAFVCSGGAVFVLRGLLSSLFSFGGGDAYLAVADGLFVEPGLLHEDAFYGNLVPLVNILPGSILCKTLSGIGFIIGREAAGSAAGGYAVAAAGFICSVAASCGVFAVIGDLYAGFRNFAIFRVIREWIRPIISGLMLTVILSLMYQSVKYGMAAGAGYLLLAVMVLVYLLNLLLIRKKAGNILRISLSAAAGYLLCCLVMVLI